MIHSSLSDIGKINLIRYRGYYYDTETGFYYLQSRYYDPSIGRFINADSFASTGQDFVGYNMFAYCGNNPIGSADPSGYAWWGVNQVAMLDGCRCLANSDAPNSGVNTGNYSSTATVGVSGSVSVGPWVFGAQVGITTDLFGDSALQASYFGGMAPSDSFGCSAMCFAMFTNTPSYSDLEGPGTQAGCTFPCSPAISLDYVILQNPDNPEEALYNGFALAMGKGASDVHVVWGETFTWKKVDFNILDYFDAVYWDVITRW